MIYVGEIPVVFEGRARLRWVTPGTNSAAPAGSRGAPLLTDAWPDPQARRAIQRRIKMLGRTLVVFDGDDRVQSMNRSRVPQVPAGVLVEHDADGTCRVSADPLSWLPERQRIRGLAFRREAAATADRWSRAGAGPIVIEPGLVGSAEPLRFVYRCGAMGLGDLRETIDRLFRQQADEPCTTWNLGVVGTAKAA